MHASNEFKADPEIVLMAIRQHKGILGLASSNLHADRELMLSALKHGDVLAYASNDLRSDREVAMSSV